MDNDLLRDVALNVPSGTYRLTLWATPYCDARGRTRLAYRLTAPGGDRVLFAGEDFAGSPMHADDSDMTVRALLTFLTLRPGDTDPNYFDGYTDEQRAFAAADAENLSLFASEELNYPLPDWED